MARHINTIEDDFEYRIKAILRKWLEDYEYGGGNDDADAFEEHLRFYAEEFGNAVIDDIVTYMGVPTLNDLTEDDEEDED